MLRYRYHVYAMKDGRISVTYLNDKNLDYVADSIAKTLEKLKTTAN